MQKYLIQSDPAIMMGKPVIAGTRITVESILEKLAAGEGIKQIMEEHPRLSEEKIRAALAFASAALRADVVYPMIETGVHDTGVALKISDFQLPPTAELAEIASKVGDSRELIDYRATDWNYKGDTFHNQWQSFGVKKNPLVDYEAKHKYEGAGKYQIMVKVVDVFGNDTNKMMGVCLE